MSFGPPPLQIKNVSGETIPPRSFVKLGAFVTANGRASMEADKPDGSEGAYGVTAAKEIPADGIGICYRAFDQGVWVAFEGTAPEEGDTWGPAEGEWKLNSGGTGYAVVQVDVAAERAFVFAIGGGGAVLVGQLLSGTTDVGGTVSIQPGKLCPVDDGSGSDGSGGVGSGSGDSCPDQGTAAFSGNFVAVGDPVDAVCPIVFARSGSICAFSRIPRGSCDGGSGSGSGSGSGEESLPEYVVLSCEQTVASFTSDIIDCCDGQYVKVGETCLRFVGSASETEWGCP